MVRPGRRVDLAGGSPVRVSAGAPGSRLQLGGEMRPSRAECRKPLQEREANQRAATTSERCSHVIFTAERCLGGPSRSYRGEGNRQHSRPERMLDLSGVAGGGTLEPSNTGHQLFGMGLYKLPGTVRYPAQAPSPRSSLSCVRENRTHRLKGGYMETGPANAGTAP